MDGQALLGGRVLDRQGEAVVFDVAGHVLIGEANHADALLGEPFGPQGEPISYGRSVTKKSVTRL
jgi:hypothetical protein